jgi:hypothetical protein
MRAVTASFIGFCFMIPSAWAVEVSAPVPRLHSQQLLLSKLLPHKHLLRALLHSRLELFQQLRQLLRLFSRLRKSRSPQKKLPSRKPSKMPKSKL